MGVDPDSCLKPPHRQQSREFSHHVVAIEEHHIIPEMSSSLGLNQPPPATQARLHATVDERLADMDTTGIDMQVLPCPKCCPPKPRYH
jgi:hypothetical protein